MAASDWLSPHQGEVFMSALRMARGGNADGGDIFRRRLTFGANGLSIPAMIEFSDSAARQLHSMKEEHASEGQLLRVFVEPGGCSGFEYGMAFDDIKDGDGQFEHNGVTFVVDAASQEYLKGCQVNFDDGLQGKGFEINNPSATSTCGCGKSFH